VPYPPHHETGIFTMPDVKRTAEIRDVRRTFVGGSDARIIMGTDKLGYCGCGGRNGEKRSLRICPATSSSSSGQRPKISIGAGTRPIRGRSLSMCKSAFIIQACAGWRRRWTDGSRPAGRYLRQSSCCPGHSRKKPQLRNTCRSCSTICGSSRRAAPCSLSSPGAANGWRSRSMPIRSTST
jgi:hypothetical protein